MLNWIAIVLGMQLIGELTATLLGLPIPGPVIGMVLLLLLLLYLGQLPDQLERLLYRSAASFIPLLPARDRRRDRALGPGWLRAATHGSGHYRQFEARTGFLFNTKRQPSLSVTSATCSSKIDICRVPLANSASIWGLVSAVM